MEDENEYKKLPTEDKCVHKLWKARLTGYEEAMKLFNQIVDEKSPEWNKYLGLIKKFVTDSNAVAQEKGLEAALVFVENCGHAGKTTGEVMSGIVAKCIAAPKTKTKDLALQITLMYVEIEKQEIVQEELMKGMENKNPKVVAACIVAMNSALKQFGNKVITIKPMVKKIPILLSDRDKTVRDEMKALVVEMHRWIGPAIEPHIASLQAVIQQELRESFGSGGAPRPTRFLRSQQTRDTPQADVADGVPDDEDADVADRDPGEQDPFEFMDPVEILSKLPKDFYDKLEQKKWQERKEALDALDALLKTAPRLEHGDYADLVRALKKIISKDSNVLLVALAGRQLGQIAAGLRNKFQPYAVACVQAILEKFKEKKANVVAALRDAIDAIYPSTNLEAIMEDMLAAFENKNPSIKAESSLFLARALCITQPQAFNKKLLKAYVAGLLKVIESADPTVRDAAAEALGTATKLVGEKNIAPHIGKIDPLKEQKIRECAEKAVIQVKMATPKKEAKKVPPSVKPEAKPSAGSTKPKPVVKKSVAPKKPVAGKKGGRSQPSPPREQELSQEEVDMKAEELLPPDVVAGLTDSNWKNRLTAVQNFLQVVQGLKPEEATSQLLFRILNNKPGLKDTNVQVLKARLEAAKYIAENFPMTTTSVDSIMQDIVTKLGEAACSNACGAWLFAACEACGLEYVAGEALTFAMDAQKNPKVQAELFNWLANALKHFGNIISINCVIPHLKKALSATNPNVRTAAVSFIGVMSLYTGSCLINHFDGEKPATKQLLSLEVEKYANSAPPPATRQAAGKIAKSASKASVGTDDVEEDEEVLEDEPVVEDSRPRTDIAPLITDALVLEMNDKNWKVRNEALDKLKAIITNSAPIKPSLGELPPALQLRLADSNSKLVQLAIQICESLATAMGTKCKQHVRTFFPAFFLAFGDSKQWIRTAAVACVDTWCREAGGAQVALEGEMVADALKAGSPVVRAILLNWLVVTLPNVPPKSFNREELIACVPTLFACIEDRSADVRKAASDCVLPYMLHLGYEGMFKHLDKLKPGSKSVVQAVLDKARPNLPVQPLPPAKGRKEDVRGVKSAGALKKEAPEKKGASVKTKTLVKPSSAGRGKKDDEDFSPLLPVNNAKNQRIIDDQKLKVLKWNFTQPRDEFNELLKEQMTSAGVNKQLMANMFHTDFRYHLKAIESLSDDLQDNGPALMANLDLVLKWLTLRFFDTNPSVILKGLEYLSVVFQRLTESDYTMPEYEANCFIPYLVLKVGDPKDTVRHAVKALFKQICVVYSVTKLFGYLMEGLKSKNARQRAECLECIGHLLETYGSSIMSPSATVALKELARHIGDRDNAVRSAALNCVTNAYFLEGEKIYKMIGQIADKDMSLLEERIKRAGKNRAAMIRRPIVPLTPAGRPMQPPMEDDTLKCYSIPESLPGNDDDDKKEDLEDEPMSPEMPSTVAPEPRVITGPFGLDPELIARLDAQVPKLKSYDLPEPDLKFLEESVPMANLVASLRHKFQMSPRTNNPVSIISSPQQHLTDDSQLADTIHSIASPDLNVAIRALSLVSGAMVSGRGAGLGAHEERLVCAVASQIRRLRTNCNELRDVLPPLKCIAQVLTTFFETGGCGSHLGAVGVGQILGELLQVLGGTGAILGPEADRFVRVLNNVCVRLLERSPRTALVSAIVTLLQESIGVDDPASPRYQDLLLKCFWKTLKTMVNWEVNSLDYDTVLYKIHLFYKAHPNSFWKKTSLSDTPYRTIKTLIHTLVKMKGASITNHLTLIPDVNDSDVYCYLGKVLKQANLDEKKENNNAGPSEGSELTTAAVTNQSLNAGRLPRSVHDELALILKRIGSKEHNTDALQQLYDLRERHPEVDIWTFMQGSSFYFRNYVERGLREVGEQRRMANVPQFKRDFTTEAVDVNNENEDTSHVIFLERLRALQAKAGLKGDAAAAATPQRQTSDNRPHAQSARHVRPRSIDPQFDLNSSLNISNKNEADVEALRLKLQQIRTNSRR